MFDIWGFFLQTLTVSGVAVLLLVIKGIFKDKLPPKWHFAAWGVLGIMILIPAGFGGRYILFNWQFVVELIKLRVGDYSGTRVHYPIPILTDIPKTTLQWIFAGYVTGVVIHFIKYAVSYIRLCLILRNSKKPDDGIIARIKQIADSQKVRVRRVRAVNGIPSAFVYGIFRPVLVIPANEEIDDKVFLHEILHMKYRDNIWSIVICLLRCLHWCNPIVIYCANRALNDMEARCDQHVLEKLEGEERREYGKILLSMANDRFAKVPGSTCINNGGRKIRKRIETIARFKLFPAGMKLVSVCVIIMLLFSLFVGVQASTVYNQEDTSMSWSIASARSTWCTTPAGAFDTYAKSLLDLNDVYRIMCAPIDMHEDMTNELIKQEKEGLFCWDVGLLAEPDRSAGYFVYNLRECDNNTYEGLLVIKLQYSPYEEDEEDDDDDEDKMYFAIQNLRAFEENGRWVIIPLEEFEYVEPDVDNLNMGCSELPSIIYSATTSDFRVEVKVQTVNTVENSIQNDDEFIFGDGMSFDINPKPHAEFTNARISQRETVIHLGAEDEREKIEKIDISFAEVYDGEERPEKLPVPTGDSSFSNGVEGYSFSEKTEKGWGPDITFENWAIGNFTTEATFPEYYVTDLYVNDKLVEQMDLVMKEGVAQ